jgi:hypothetical protein
VSGLTPRDHYFADMSAVLEIPIRQSSPLERKYPINNRADAVHLDDAERILQMPMAADSYSR